MPQLPAPPVLKHLEFSTNEEVGNWKANKSFLHPLYLPLTSFLTFLLSFTFLCRNISARTAALLTLLGLRLVHEICHSHRRLPLGTGSLQLHARGEQISPGSRAGWAGDKREVLEWCRRQMVFPHDGASGGQACCQHRGRVVLSCPPSSHETQHLLLRSRTGLSFPCVLCLRPAVLLFPSFLPYHC